MSQSGSIIEQEHLGTELLPTPGSRTIAGSNGAGIAPWKLHFAAGSWPIWQAGEAEEELLGYCQGGDADDQYQIALCPHTSWRQPFFNMMNGHGGSQTPALLKPPIRHCDRGVQAARRHSCSHRGKIGPGCLAAKFHDRQAQRKGESSSAYAALVAEPGLTNCTHEPNGSIM